MFRCCCCALLLFGCVVACSAQIPSSLASPQETTVCDLIHNAKSFDGRVVRVRGHVRFGFEDAGISDPACPVDWSGENNLTSIWVMYGGDQDDPEVYCCGDHRKRGVDLTIRGQHLPLVRDASLQKFRERIEAERLRRPDGTECYDNCKFYRVTASITGTFFAAGAGTFGGYGHLGCCHLLVIQQVSDVDAERTEIPLGGEFKCTTETWEPAPEEVAKLKIFHDCPGSSFEVYRACNNSAYSEVATHWGEPGRRFDVLSIHDELFSPDLLTSYAADETKDAAKNSTIVRKSCRPELADKSPRPATDVVACENTGWPHWNNAAEAAKFDAILDANKFKKTTQMLVRRGRSYFSDPGQPWHFDSGEHAASHVLEVMAGKWAVAYGPGLPLEKCQEDTFQVEELGIRMDCTWVARDGLQEVRVSLVKFTGAEIDPKDRSVPWQFLGADVRTCHIN